jgi:hypothetical protein
MAAGPQQVLVDPSPGVGRRRLHIHGIKEMPAGYDAEVAELFRDLRAASNLSETDLAQRIATPIEVVQALEQGAIYALPPWPETCRVVNAYGTLLNLDTRPLLRRIYAQLEAGIVQLRPKTMPDVPVMPQAGNDGGFGAGNNLGQAPARQPQAAPRPPQRQAPAPQAPWPNGQQHAPRPQAPLPNGPQRAAQPQAPSPQAPSQQAAWPGATPQFPQGGFGGVAKQAPQAPAWPNGPQAPQPQPQARPPRPQPNQQPHTYSAEPPAAAPLQGEDATFVVEPEPAKKTKKPALLKWGIIALVASAILIGLWLVLGQSSGPTTSSGFNASEPVLDPDDPRSRKADKLPSKFPDN